jgi:ferric-dicitrate binding protein FerR (iron transport regulator)
MTPGGHEDLDPITLARFLSGESDAAEAARVRRWIASDPANAELVAQLRPAWAPDASRDEGWDVDGAWRRMKMHVGSQPAPSGKQGRRPSHRPAVMPLTSRARPRWRMPVAIAAALVVAIGVWHTGHAPERHGHDVRPADAAVRELTTAAGERAGITLGDGIDVMLAPGSRLRYTPGTGSGRREVYLEGEALFRVQHDTARPFIVHTADAVTEDIGTEFSVRRYLAERTTRVVVGEGRVALRGIPKSGATMSGTELGAGDLARVGRDGRAPVVRKVDARRYFAWKDGWIVFDDARLSSVSADLARWYDIDIVVADSTLLDRRLVASFRAATVDDALHIVASSLGVNVERHGRRVVISRKRTS